MNHKAPLAARGRILEAELRRQQQERDTLARAVRLSRDEETPEPEEAGKP